MRVRGHSRARRRALRGRLALAAALTLTLRSSAASPPAGPETASLPPSAGPGDVEQAVLEFHLLPVADLQLAIWLEDPQGNFIEDVFVTQATGTLGIGNRPGMPLFLSSWRAPYGPREGVLPIWAHRRGSSYPKIIFWDASDHGSQGYHETTSSPESYFCRPLTPEEDEVIVDTMTCPSPSTFSTDKGRIVDDESSVYPPRSDLSGAHDKDSPDVALFAALNDLDAISGATPLPGPTVIAHRITRSEVPAGPLVAWIEVSLERDENPDWEFDREDDHTLDGGVALQHFGREFLGQPSIVYRVEFDPAELGYVASSSYAGYGDLYGQSGALFPPDPTISTTGGSGADRLRVHGSFGLSGRVGVYNHGWGSGEGACPEYTPPAVEELDVEAVDFNRIRARFRLPQLPAGVEPAQLRAHWITPETDTFELAAAKSVADVPRLCRAPGEQDCIDPRADELIELDIAQLFGNHSYSIAINYEDRCTNRSELAVSAATTPVQRFTTIDGACFIATAAWGTGWTEELRALRWLRDAYMIGRPVAGDLVAMYYAYGPTMATMIRELPQARAGARLLLRPLARLARLAAPD